MTTTTLNAPASRLHAAATTLGIALVIAPTLIRTLAPFDPMPYWSTDPFILWLPHTAIGPAAIMVLNFLTILGAALILATARTGRPLAATTLLVLGSIPIFIHGLRHDTNFELGMPWIAAAAAAIAIAHLPRASTARTIIFAALASLLVMFTARGIVQVFIEHPHTIADYELQREIFLESRGWSPDSMMARNYERRLYQPEATGWFGLANVYASFAAAYLAAFAILAWRAFALRDDRRMPLVMLAAAECALASLYLAGSKGALGALLLALPAFLIFLRLGPRARILIALVPIAALAAIIARGLIGERIAELSLLFRWFYLQGATAIFLDHPLIGVGPAGFKDAYMLAKPPLSPEEVQSPHSIFFEYLATLGLFALAWIALLAAACRSIAHSALTPAHSPASLKDSHQSTDQTRLITLSAFAFLGLSIATSALIESQLITIPMAIARITALLLALTITAAIARIAARDPRALPIASAAAALVLLAHAQIEVTATWSSSAPLAAIFLGLACSPAAPTPRHSRLRSATIASLFIPACAFSLASSITFSSPWQATLHRAAQPIGRLAHLESAIQSPPPEGPAAIDHIAAWARTPRAKTSLELAHQLDIIRRDNLRTAASLFTNAAGRPDHIPTRQTAARLNLHYALLAGSPSHAAEAIRHAQEAVNLNPLSPAALATLSSIHEALANRSDLTPDSGLAPAIAAMERAATLDPHGLTYPLRLVSLHQRAGNPDQAAHYARIALQNHEKLRLDPLRQLTPTEYAHLSAIVRANTP